ncbi:MAG TPA: ABC transporter permease [Ktedonobacteraceae bacterium]
MSTIITSPALTNQQHSLRLLRPSFFGLVRGEIFKVVRQWTPWIALVLMLGIIGLPFLLFFTTSGLKELILSPHYDYFYERMPIGFALLRAFGGIVLVVITARIIGQEYSLGTIRVVLARGVGRVQLLLAKMTATALLALALVTIGLLEIALLSTVQIQLVAGSLNPLISLPASVWHDFGLYLLAILLSMGATLLMTTAVSVIFHSLAGALSASIIWFPIDNMLVLMLSLIFRLTKSDFWLNVTAYLLGPNLNALAGLLAQRSGSIWQFGFGPQITVDSTHALLVALVYSLIFAAVAIIFTWKRDVQE